LRRILPVAIAVGVLAGLLSVASALAAPGGSTKLSPRAAHTIKWHSCSDPSLKKLHAQCGYLSVPLDYSKPSGTQIQIAVSRIRHTSKHYQGILLTNPGGPGGSGLNLNAFLIPVLKQEGFKQAANDYDWIGFDPRGVDRSAGIRCLTDAQQDATAYLDDTPDTPQELYALVHNVSRIHICRCRRATLSSYRWPPYNSKYTYKC